MADMSQPLHDKHDDAANMLDLAGCALLLGRSQRHIRRLRAIGAFPQPCMTVGPRCLTWCKKAILTWAEGGGPTLRPWQRKRRTRTR